MKWIKILVWNGENKQRAWNGTNSPQRGSLWFLSRPDYQRWRGKEADALSPAPSRSTDSSGVRVSPSENQTASSLWPSCLPLPHSRLSPTQVCHSDAGRHLNQAFTLFSHLKGKSGFFFLLFTFGHFWVKITFYTISLITKKWGHTADRHTADMRDQPSLIKLFGWKM